jgi:hypothetical protein
MTLVLLPFEPATLKDTLEGVLVLTSREVPVKGKSFWSKSLEDLPRSWGNAETCTIYNKHDGKAIIPSRMVELAEEETLFLGKVGGEGGGKRERINLKISPVMTRTCVITSVGIHGPQNFSGSVLLAH